ncbi:DNA internalization-related competence protein ComEC/Rec2 [Rhizobacter sp. Root1221]|uniref:DNA internalization-related competence protein ComEC/Rec2 n=1 Tax=Rhizobacter sp. Root1221 TaxID=1736433 RepID=UPI000A671CC7|nr:DNA internalization-related competence protein ComEC/Rec2 [Rhizobacter sp. Root1221]
MNSGVNFGWRGGALCAAWLAGVLAHLQLRELPAAGGVLAVVAAGAALAVTAIRRRRVGWACVAAMLLGFGLSAGQALHRLAQALPIHLESEDLVLDGTVAAMTQVLDNGLRFRFDVRTAHWNGAPVDVPPHVLLGWYAGFGGRATPGGPPPDFRAGDRWRFTVRLRRPHGLRNPNGFDQELHLFEQGLRAVGSVKPGSGAAPERLGTGWAHPVERARQHVRDTLFATVPGPREAGVLAALAVGDQSAIDRHDWQVFRDTGIAHLVSISGLHITMFAWVAGWGLRRLWARSTAACLCVPAPVAGRVGGLAAALAYAAFAGWGVPAQRTVWMLATVTLLQAAGGRWPLPLVLLLAAAVVSAADPWALLQAGFWLSFGAVALLMVSSGPGAPAAATRLWDAVVRGLRNGVKTQLVASAGLAPLSLMLFQQVSVVGFVANLVAIPLFTLAITPLALLGVLCAPLWLAGAWLVQQAGVVLQAISTWPGGVWTSPAAPAWAQLASLCGAACLVMPLPWRLRLLAVPLLVPLALPAVPRPAHGRFELLAADVGQGTAVLVRTRSHLLVYDTGPQYSPDTNAGERVLLPLLRARGEHHIDRLTLSHRDTDHVGGAEALLTALPVHELLSSLEPGHPLLGLAHADRRCDAGQSWVWDGVQFDVLHPLDTDHARPLKPNAKSCVLRVQGDNGSALLAGDIERAQEAQLVAAGAPLASDVLLVPHHGSRTSSTAAFLDAVQPSVALIQAGYRNRFGHPVAEVLGRLEDRGVKVFTSPACGAWHWSGDGTAAGGRCERPTSARYWHARGTLPPDGRK